MRLLEYDTDNFITIKKGDTYEYYKVAFEEKC